MASVCAHCAAELDENAMKFQEYEYGSRYWEEDTGKGRQHSLSDKIKDSVKFLCPACAHKFRIEIRQERILEMTISIVITVVFSAFMLIMIFASERLRNP